MTKKNTRKSSGTLWILLLILGGGLAALLGFAVYQYKTEGTDQTGIVVCGPDSCIKTVHIHADIAFDLCGEGITLPWESGPLSGLHTHKEKNYLHFHDKLALDFTTREELPEKRLTVGEVVSVFDLKPEKFCGKGSVRTEVIRNTVLEPKGLETEWRDGDTIEVRYIPLS